MCVRKGSGITQSGTDQIGQVLYGALCILCWLADDYISETYGSDTESIEAAETGIVGLPIEQSLGIMRVIAEHNVVAGFSDNLPKCRMRIPFLLAVTENIVFDRYAHGL